MTLISSAGLQGAYEVYYDILEAFEHNRTYKTAASVNHN